MKTGPERLTLFPGDKMPVAYTWPSGATFGAINGVEVYRYDLRRIWGEAGLKSVNFIMLNPSTADATKSDPTITRCLNFAKAWGYGGLVVTNLFAYRATDPKVMRTAIDPVGPHNDDFIKRWALSADLVVCGWGTGGGFMDRGRKVIGALQARQVQVHALRVTKDGHPGHPLYVPAWVKPQPMETAS